MLSRILVLLVMLMGIMSCNKVKSKYPAKTCLVFEHGNYKIYFQVVEVVEGHYMAKSRVNQTPWSEKVEKIKFHVLDNEDYYKKVDQCPK